MKEKLMKEIRLNNVEVRADDQEEGKMIIEGYPIVFDKETFIEGWDGKGFYEKIDKKAFDNADMSDICLKYNHNDDFLILARTRNKSLTYTIDEKGVFMHADLIDTTQNRDIYKMVKADLINEGSFAFTITDDAEEIKDGNIHRTIKGIGKVFDFALCPNGAYGLTANGEKLTEIYARSYEALENVRNKKVETERHIALLKLRNKNKMKLMEVRSKWN